MASLEMVKIGKLVHSLSLSISLGSLIIQKIQIPESLHHARISIDLNWGRVGRLDWHWGVHWTCCQVLTGPHVHLMTHELASQWLKRVSVLTQGICPLRKLAWLGESCLVLCEPCSNWKKQLTSCKTSHPLRLISSDSWPCKYTSPLSWGHCFV